MNHPAGNPSSTTLPSIHEGVLQYLPQNMRWPSPAANHGPHAAVAAPVPPQAQPYLPTPDATPQQHGAAPSGKGRTTWRHPVGTKGAPATYASLPLPPSFSSLPLSPVCHLDPTCLLIPSIAYAVAANKPIPLTSYARHTEAEITTGAMLINLRQGFFRPENATQKAEWKSAFDEFRPLVVDAVQRMAAAGVPRWAENTGKVAYAFEAGGDAVAGARATPTAAAASELVFPSYENAGPSASTGAAAAHVAAAVPMDVLPSALAPPKAFRGAPMMSGALGNDADVPEADDETDLAKMAWDADEGQDDADAVAILAGMKQGEKSGVTAQQHEETALVSAATDQESAGSAESGPPPKRQRLKLSMPRPPQRLKLSMPKPPRPTEHDSEATLTASPSSSDATMADGPAASGPEKTARTTPPPPAAVPVPMSRSGRNLRRPKRLGEEVENAGDKRRGDGKRKRRDS